MHTREFRTRTAVSKIPVVTQETTGAEDRMSYTQTSLSNTTFLMIVNISHFSVRDICNSHIETLDSERKPNGKISFNQQVN